jgi:exopolysaccharide biosynthesis polyprenyl glycosylphosphotransferase
MSSRVGELTIEERVVTDSPALDRAQPLPSSRRGASLQRWLLATGDVVAIAAALWLVLAVAGEQQSATTLLVCVPLVALVFKIAGLYDRDQLRLLNSTLDEAPLLLQLTGIYVLLVTILQSAGSPDHLPAAQIAGLWLASFMAVIGARMLTRWWGRRVTPVERCLVIGERRQADRIRQKLASSRARAIVVATFPFEGLGETDPLDSEYMRRLVVELEVERIVIAPTTTDAGSVAELIRIAKAAGAQVSVLPRMLEVLGSAVEFEDVDGMTMLGVRPFGLPRSSRRLKRAFDVVATSIALLAVAPVIAATVLAIRLDTRGSAFFRQVRVGRDGRPFRIYKFRSMVLDADAKKEWLRPLNEVGAGMFKIDSDPRVTGVGRLLRRSSLDELPQLFNVLRGEMSLVGPRPLVTDEDAQILGLDRSRLHLTPGMTGPWQVLGARVPMQEMVGLDYMYVSNWSLWHDVKLLIRTVRHVLRRGNS